MKKILCFVLTLVMCIGLLAPAFAYTPQDPGKTVTVGEFGYIDTEGGLWLWGPNDNGQAGQDPGAYRGESWVKDPHKVMDDVVAFAKGSTQTIALKKDGSVWVLGYTWYDGLPTSTYTPIKVFDGCVAVSAGFASLGAVKSDGTLYTWGSTDWLECGHPSSYDADRLPDSAYDRNVKVDVAVPSKLMTDTANVYMAHGSGFSIKNNGDLWCWGGNLMWYDGWVNDGGDCMRPTKLWSGANAKQIWAYNSGDGVFVTNSSGELWVWGLQDSAAQNPYIVWRFNSRQKLTTNVKYLVGTMMDNYAGGEYRNYAYVIKNDNALYGHDGSVKIADNVNAAVMTDSYYGNTCKLILYNDGTLVAKAGTNCGRNDRLTEDKVIAKNVALSHQPFSSIGAPAVSDTVGGFQDVHTYDWFANAVVWAVDNRITSGTSATTFSPTAYCTQAQILTFLWNANGKPMPSGSNPFKNVKNGQWYTNACIWAYEKGIITDVDLDVNAHCTRGDVANYLYREAGSPSLDYLYVFTDVPFLDQIPVSWCYRNKITAGMGVGATGITFGTAQTCTRAQIVTFLYNAYGK